MMFKTKKFWRCTICGDQHWGIVAPEICPTCGFPREKSIEITEKDFVEKIEEVAGKVE